MIGEEKKSATGGSEKIFSICSTSAEVSSRVLVELATSAKADAYEEAAEAFILAPWEEGFVDFLRWGLYEIRKDGTFLARETVAEMGLGLWLNWIGDWRKTAEVAAAMVVDIVEG